MASWSLPVVLSALLAATALANPGGMRGGLNETLAPTAAAAAAAVAEAAATLVSSGFSIASETSADTFPAELPAAAATEDGSFDGWFSVRNENSQKGLTVKCYMWCHAGTEVVQYSIGNQLFPDTDKQWMFVNVGSDGAYALKNKKSDLFLAAAVDGQAVVLGRNSDALEAQWHMDCPDADAACTLKNAKSQLLLAIDGDSLDNMAAATLRAHPLPSAAAWRFMPASS